VAFGGRLLARRLAVRRHAEHPPHAPGRLALRSALAVLRAHGRVPLFVIGRRAGLGRAAPAPLSTAAARLASTPPGGPPPHPASTLGSRAGPPPAAPPPADGQPPRGTSTTLPEWRPTPPRRPRVPPATAPRPFSASAPARATGSECAGRRGRRS